MRNSKDLAVGHQAPNSREIPRTNVSRSWVFRTKGAWLILVLFGATLEIYAQTNSSGTNAASYLVPPYGEMQPTFWELHGEAVIVITGALVVAVVCAVWLALLPRRVEPPAPVLVARKELAQLSRRPEDGACLSAVSQVLRRYFISAFRLADGELNTSEFSAAIAAKPEIGAELAKPLADFLRECDERKFSPAAGAEPLGAAHKAEDFLARAEARRAAIQRPTT